MSKRKKHYDKSVYRSFALVMQFGLNMLVPICLMSALGIWLDNYLGTSFWMILLFFAGAIAGGQNVYRMARQVYAPADRSGQKSQAQSFTDKGTGHRSDRTIKTDEQNTP